MDLSDLLNTALEPGTFARAMVDSSEPIYHCTIRIVPRQRGGIGSDSTVLSIYGNVSPITGGASLVI